jgi:phage tail sheath protein FI
VRVDVSPGTAAPEAEAYLEALKALDQDLDVTIIAAPGAFQADDARCRQIAAALITNAEQSDCRIALLDSILGQDAAGVRAWRAPFESASAALYYPWLRVGRLNDPNEGTILQPPSGFVAGVLARLDAAGGIWQKPAVDQVILSVIDVETTIDNSLQAVLDAEDINSIRGFPGHGNQVWGARSLSTNADWKYITINRFLFWLQRSIEHGTQWATEEKNGEALWLGIRQAIAPFLTAQWHAGALTGTSAAQAFFVKCDRTTMTQADIDAGRIVCLVGVATRTPSEFVTLRIEQNSADSTSLLLDSPP